MRNDQFVRTCIVQNCVKCGEVRVYFHGILTNQQLCERAEEILRGSATWNKHQDKDNAEVWDCFRQISYALYRRFVTAGSPSLTSSPQMTELSTFWAEIPAYLPQHYYRQCDSAIIFTCCYSWSKCQDLKP